MTHPDEGAESPDLIALYEIQRHTSAALVTAKEVERGLTDWLRARGIPCHDTPAPSPDTHTDTPEAS